MTINCVWEHNGNDSILYADNFVGAFTRGASKEEGLNTEIDIRFVSPEDKNFWFSLDKHLPEAEFDKKVRDKQGYVLCFDNKPVGLLRYNLFWDNTPFCTLLFIDGRYRRQGFGRSLMKHWEQDMRAQGYGMAIVSTQVDEDAQHFFRKLGYRDCGGLTVDVPGYEQPMELFMVKQL